MAAHISRQPEARPAPDALDTLANDQSVVHRLFDAFDQAACNADSVRKSELAKAICREISAKTKSTDDQR